MQRRAFSGLLALVFGIALARPASPADTGLWSLEPIAFPRVPDVSAQSPIDAFVLAKLKQKGLTLSPEADRRTLIRRATFDLIGLPPTPEEVAAFVADTRPDAYERLVDRLLASPHYGERWARRWLDVVRFGESHGYEYDHLRENAWRYRDWVVRSLNADKPYDRFLKEQLAGDALPGAGEDGVIATGFLVAGPMDEAGKASAGVPVRLRAREEELEDMIGVVGQTCLGLTVNCARCHDHKFDPIPQRDYYRLKAALAGVQPGDRPTLPPRQVELRAARAAELRRQRAELQRRISALEEPAHARLTPETSDAPRPLLRWRFPLSGKTTRFQSEPIPTEIREKTLEAWVRLADLTQRGGSALALETDGGEQFDAIVFGEREPGKWLAGSEFYHRTKDLDAPAETETGLVQVAIVYRADGQVQVFRNGKPYAAAYRPETAARTYPAGKSHVLIGPRHTGSKDVLRGEVTEARLYDRALTDAELASSFRSAPFSVSPEALERALTPDERLRRDALRIREAALAKEIEAREKPSLTYAATSKEPGPTYVLPRGDVLLQGEPVTAGGLSALTACSPEFGLSPDAPEASRRLALAGWITDPSNPLTARVIVNRVWQGHFGRGIVGTPSDFGFNGDAPTHPELLDWLATAFMGPGEWSLKRLHRAILLSRTYRQASAPNPKAIKLDPDDRLLWRFAPRRLEAEEVRDSLLAASGRLNPALGGPSFRPFTVSRYGSDFYQLVDSDAPEFNRRTLYRMVVQSARSPLLETFDCPDPSTKTPKRTVTTTPIQALALMNDGFVLRQSRALAARLQRDVGSDRGAQITRAYALALGRPPTPTERARALDYLKTHPLDSFCWALFNASEFLYVR